MKWMRRWLQPASRLTWQCCSRDGSARVDEVLREATLVRPAAVAYQWHGKRGVHTEHLGHMLAEMQHLQRTYPGAQW